MPKIILGSRKLPKKQGSQIREVQQYAVIVLILAAAFWLIKQSY